MAQNVQNRKDSFHLPKIQATLTSKDSDLLRSFRALCTANKLSEFSSDDFRMYGLDRFTVDKAHELGGLFAKWKVNGIIEDTGKRKRSVLPQNHGREIKVYKWVSRSISSY